MRDRVESLEGIGRTVIAVAADGKPLGLLALGDQLRPEAREAIDQLRGAGLRPVIVTGDNARAAGHVAEQLGIDDVRAGVLPEGEAEIVRGLQRGGLRGICFVGDGVNDSAALAAAQVGVAMGGGPTSRWSRLTSSSSVTICCRTALQP